MITTSPLALITGSSRRIGRTIAELLHKEGFNIAIHYKSHKDAAHALALELNQVRENSAKIFYADLSIEREIEELVKRTVHWQGNLNILINNASIFLRDDDPDFDFNLLYQVNSKAPYLLSLHAKPYLEKNQGQIVHITDTHAHRPLKHYQAYCMSKAALSMLMKSQAKSWAPNIRTNAIAPGAILWPEGKNKLNEHAKENILAAIPLRKHGSPNHIAKAVLSILNNDYLNGVEIAVDGGRHL